MVTHGSESYFVIGEGLLAESVGGRDGSQNGAGPRRRDGRRGGVTTPPFRFSRMGPSGAGKQLGEGARKRLGEAMAGRAAGESQIPAGFTYLGQFIDHDLTFDKTDVMLGANVTPAQLLQARSPSLDLDSLYGAGPQDPGSAKFYEADGLHLKMGKTTGPAKNGFDLPRGAGNTVAKKRKAIIPDPRNDENLAVAQTHLAMIRFHNRVVDTQLGGVPDAQKFEARARDRDEALPVDDPHGLSPADREKGGRRQRLQQRAQGLRGGRGADGRADHADRVLDRGLPARARDGAGELQLEQDLRQRRRHARPAVHVLGDRRQPRLDTRLASIWIADFRRLYDFSEANKPNLTVPASKFNRAMRIDTRIVDPLQHLPPQTVGLPNSTGFNDVAAQPGLPQPHAREDGEARHRPADGRASCKNKGVNLTRLTKHADPRRQQRRRPRAT